MIVTGQLLRKTNHLHTNRRRSKQFCHGRSCGEMAECRVCDKLYDVVKRYGNGWRKWRTCAQKASIKFQIDVVVGRTRFAIRQW